MEEYACGHVHGGGGAVTALVTTGLGVRPSMHKQHAMPLPALDRSFLLIHCDS
jgi:hypothetical protein